MYKIFHIIQVHMG